MRGKKFNPIPFLTAAVGGMAGRMVQDVVSGIPQVATKSEFAPAIILVAATGADYFLSGPKTSYLNDALKGAAGVAGADLSASLLNGYRLPVQGYRMPGGGRAVKMNR